MKRQKRMPFKPLWILIIAILCSPSILMADICTDYDFETGTLHIPSVQIGESFFWMDMQLVDIESLRFRLTDFGESEKKVAQAVFDLNTLKLHIPCIDFKISRTYEGELTLVTGETINSIDLVVDTIVENNDSLVINEIAAKDAGGGNDWIELFAMGDQALELNTYALVDGNVDHEKAPLPSMTLNPGDYVVIQATDEIPEDGSAYVPFKLGADDSLILYQNDEIADIFQWEDGDAPGGYSYGRAPDGTGVPQLLSPTPGSTNVMASPTTVTRPEGWDEVSHGVSANPDYNLIFQEGVVNRIDLIFDSNDWEAMLADMATLYGEFGSGNTTKRPEPTEPHEGMTPPDNMEPPDNMLPPEDMAPSEEDVTFPDGMQEQPDMNPGGNLNFTDENPVWKPCTIQFNGKEWYFAGARFKGNSSLSSSWKSGIMKLPFRFDFDKFQDEHPEIENQRFHGFEKLSLASNYRDDSLIREKVVADIFRNAGTPAPRTAFYRLYVDHGEGPIYFGLYTMVEIPSEPMLESQFSQSGGNLYKPEGDGATFATYDKASFDKETNEDDADYSDIEALYEALHADRQDSGSWREGVEKVFNVDGFLRWLAVNTLIQNWDTYGMMAHNYYLYNDPGEGRIHWIPWDNNEALKNSGGSVNGPLSLNLSADEVNDNWPLIRYLMDDSIYRARYVDLVEESMTTVFYPERMETIYTDAWELIRSYVTGDSGEISGYTFLDSDTAFDTALDSLINHVETRFNEAQEFIRLNQ